MLELPAHGGDVARRSPQFRDPVSGEYVRRTMHILSRPADRTYLCNLPVRPPAVSSLLLRTGGGRVVYLVAEGFEPCRGCVAAAERRGIVEAFAVPDSEGS